MHPLHNLVVKVSDYFQTKPSKPGIRVMMLLAITSAEQFDINEDGLVFEHGTPVPEMPVTKGYYDIFATTTPERPKTPLFFYNGELKETLRELYRETKDES